MIELSTTPARRSVVEMLSAFRTPRPAAMMALLAVDLALYLLTWWGVLVVEHPIAKLFLAVINGLLAGRLFVLGHDACHGSAFPARWANELFGRLAFLPTLTPFSTWELGHNSLHHGFTNLRGKDYVYAPLTKSEFDGLPGWRRLLERMYRHPFGPGLCYAVEIWWQKLWFPSRSAAGNWRWKYLADSLLCSAFLALLMAVAWKQGPWMLIVAVIIPFATWLCLMGFATFQHHTHPSVVWFDDRKRWDPLAAQLENTVHVEFPKVIGLLLGNIMEHTAHHVDTKIPLFSLPAAQRLLEDQFPARVTVQPWSWSDYARCCRICKLYDYERQQWIDFEGRPAGAMRD